MLLVCRGIRRLQGDSQRTRLPITINLMHIIKEQLRQSMLQEWWMLWAAFTTAFYGFSEWASLLTFVGATYHSHWTTSPYPYTSLKQSPLDVVAQLKYSSPHHAIGCYRKVSGVVSPSASLYQAGRFHPLSRSRKHNPPTPQTSWFWLPTLFVIQFPYWGCHHHHSCHQTSIMVNQELRQMV